MKWLKAKCLWLKKKDEINKRKKQDNIINPMKDNLFPYSYPYTSMYPFENVYQQTSTGNGISMNPEKNVGLGGGVP